MTVRLKINDERLPIARAASSDTVDELSVIFDGPVDICDSVCSIDVLMVYHSELGTLELVAFNPVTTEEAPRIYLSANALLTRLDEQEISARLEQKKEPFLRHHRHFDVSVLEREVFFELVSQFILSRLAQHINALTDEKLTVYLKAQPGDSMVALSSDVVLPGAMPNGLAHDFILHQPAALMPVVTTYTVNLLRRKSIFERAMGALQGHPANNSYQVARILRLTEAAVTNFASTQPATDANRETIRNRWSKLISRIIQRNVVDHISNMLKKKPAKVMKRAPPPQKVLAEDQLLQGMSTQSNSASANLNSTISSHRRFKPSNNNNNNNSNKNSNSHHQQNSTPENSGRRPRANSHNATGSPHTSMHKQADNAHLASGKIAAEAKAMLQIPLL